MKQAVKQLIVVLLLFGISCGGAEAGNQVGAAQSPMIPAHGHGSEKDGGIVNLPVFHVMRSTAQTVTTGTETLVDMTTSVIDNRNEFNLSTDRHNPKVPGWYMYTGHVSGAGATTLTAVKMLLCKNCNCMTNYIGGSQVYASLTPGVEYTFVSSGGVAYMNGSTDIMCLYGMINGTGTLWMQGRLSGFLITR